jgi:simple sugar transport system ATP-binding protein
VVSEAAAARDTRATNQRHRSDLPVVEARMINKFYGGVRALADVSVAFFPGEVVALVGDNGAGKSTFTRIIAGIEKSDSGDLFYDGTLVGRPTPRAAQKYGVEVVPQHLALCDNLSASMNVVLGRPPMRFHVGGLGIVDRRKAIELARASLNEVGATIEQFDAPIRRMSGGQRQAIAIGRALLRGGRILIFDEPTAALGVRQREATLGLIRRVAHRGLAAVMISHNIDDVFAIADRVVAFRLGRVVLDEPLQATSQDAVRRAMEGLS